MLALDTSSWWGGLALLEAAGAEEPRVVAELGVQVRDSHSNHLLRWAELLLAEAGWGREALDGFVAVRGPGSFTGIRVGLGTVRGLALAAGRPAVGVTTLEALAEAHGPAEAPRLVLLEAGRGELYGARYDAAGSPPRIVEPPWLAPGGDALALAGPAAVVIPGPATLVDPALLPPGFRLAGSPRGIAAAAGRVALLAGALERDGASPLEPLYLRPPDALFRKPREA